MTESWILQERIIHFLVLSDSNHIILTNALTNTEPLLMTGVNVNTHNLMSDHEEHEDLLL
mgnify:FL=1